MDFTVQEQQLQEWSTVQNQRQVREANQGENEPFPVGKVHWLQCRGSLNTEIARLSITAKEQLVNIIEMAAALSFLPNYAVAPENVPQDDLASFEIAITTCLRPYFNILTKKQYAYLLHVYFGEDADDCDNKVIKVYAPSLAKVVDCAYTEMRTMLSRAPGPGSAFIQTLKQQAMRTNSLRIAEALTSENAEISRLVDSIGLTQPLADEDKQKIGSFVSVCLLQSSTVKVSLGRKEAERRLEIQLASVQLTTT